MRFRFELTALAVSLACCAVACLPDSAQRVAPSDAGRDAERGNLPRCAADPPSLTFSSPVPEQAFDTNDVPLLFSVIVSPPPSADNCRYPNPAWFTYTCSLDSAHARSCKPDEETVFEHVPEGDHHFRVEVFDGQELAVRESVSFSVDLTAPELSIETPHERDVWMSAQGSFAYRASDEHLLAPSCRIDDDPEFPCDKAFDAPKLLANAAFHYFSVRASDTAGNTRTARVSFAVDAPIVTFDPPLEGVTINGVPTAQFSVTKSKSLANTNGTFQFTCDIDGRGEAPCTSGKSFPNLSADSHELTVKAYFSVLSFVGFAKARFTTL